MSEFGSCLEVSLLSYSSAIFLSMQSEIERKFSFPFYNTFASYFVAIIYVLALIIINCLEI